MCEPAKRAIAATTWAVARFAGWLNRSKVVPGLYAGVRSADSQAPTSSTA